MDVILPIAICICFLAAVIAGGTWIVHALIRRTSGQGTKSDGLGLALATALTVFVLVYLSAWAEMRQLVALGDIGMSLSSRMEHDFQLIRREISDYRIKHGQYPDALSDVPMLKDWRLTDVWNRPYQYSKTATGYRLFSFGRDGKPGGIGLDADIDSEQEPMLVEPTLTQFLFEAKGGGTLLTIALMTSCFAGIACYIASGPRKNRAINAAELFSSIAVTAVGAVLVALGLVFIYVMGEHH